MILLRRERTLAPGRKTFDRDWSTHGQPGQNQEDRLKQGPPKYQVDPPLDGDPMVQGESNHKVTCPLSPDFAGVSSDQATLIA